MHNCVFWGWADFSHQYYIAFFFFFALEIPELGIPRPLGQELGPALWNLGDRRSNPDLLKTPDRESEIEVIRLWFLFSDFKNQAGGRPSSACQRRLAPPPSGPSRVLKSGRPAFGRARERSYFRKADTSLTGRVQPDHDIV